MNSKLIQDQSDKPLRQDSSLATSSIDNKDAPNNNNIPFTYSSLYSYLSNTNTTLTLTQNSLPLKIVNKLSNQQLIPLSKFPRLKNLKQLQHTLSLLCCLLPKKLNPSLQKQKESFLSLSKLNYSAEVSLHFDTLKYIFTFFTNEKNCKQTGAHWEKIGFQDQNPKNDFRSTGMIAPLQTVFLIEHFPSFAKKFYNMLLIRKSEWLFFVSLIQFSKICIDLLKNDNGKINRMCNRLGNVWETMGYLFCGICIWFYDEMFGKGKNKNENEKCEGKLEEGVKELKAEDVNECICRIKYEILGNLDEVIYKAVNLREE